MIELPYWEVPRCWPGETVAILGGGQSLTQEQVDHCRGRCRVIAINRAGLPRPANHSGRWVSAPWADWLYGCDPDHFWTWHPEAVEFPGTKIVVRGCADMTHKKWAKLAELSERGVKVLRHSARDLPAVPRHEKTSPDPAVVRGNNSYFQLLSVIAHTGAAIVLLLGIDQRGGHWHGGYIVGGMAMASPEFSISTIPPFETLVRPLKAAGVEVVNCSPRSRLRYFGDIVPLEEVLR